MRERNKNRQINSVLFQDGIEKYIVTMSLYIYNDFLKKNTVYITKIEKNKGNNNNRKKKIIIKRI